MRALMIVLSTFFFMMGFAGKSQMPEPEFLKDTIHSIKTNNIYLELGGQTGYSFNYEHVLYRKRPLAFRAGLMYYTDAMIRGRGSPYEVYYFLHVFMVPLSCSMLFGKKNNYLEAGAGLTFYNQGQVYTPWIFYIMSNPVIGYRRQLKKGFLFRIYYSPIIFLFSNYDGILPQGIIPYPLNYTVGGISLGYSFQRWKKN